ncbi:hypothetical protein Z043_116924, partial [Scleropages formosus]
MQKTGCWMQTGVGANELPLRSSVFQLTTCASLNHRPADCACPERNSCGQNGNGVVDESPNMLVYRK